jgi:hypothetical protein
MSMSRKRMRSIAQPDRAGFDEAAELLIRVFALDISNANPSSSGRTRIKLVL